MDALETQLAASRTVAAKLMEALVAELSAGTGQAFKPGQGEARA